MLITWHVLVCLLTTVLKVELNISVLIFFNVRQAVQDGKLKAEFCLSKDNVADLFT